MPKKILFILGSVNQTKQAHAAGQKLASEYDCYYTHCYSDGLLRWAADHGLLNNTVLGANGRFRQQAEAYVMEQIGVRWYKRHRQYQLDL